ncbi:SPOR domain-containing protein [Erythrobacter sp. CCH5-A1]|jgi:hypothetical protein|uniref:SPOR domain-containing protein n=1 Tax=Erythrobacter sp. CCH5-A1 TaxID=1768792 RepID=UPI00082E1378|nr:SPOR domain-containing protein [Erythrobacter sp. CCH5-A1]
MIDAEYEDLNEVDGELGLSDTDSLPWLESDEEEEGAGGIDTSQIVLFALGLLALLGVVVAGVWYVTNRAASGEVVADGSVIPAPEGPIKQRPDDPGGKTFDGTGNVAPVVGEGGSRPGVVAGTPMPPQAGGPMAGQPAGQPSPAPTKPVPAATPAAGQAPQTGGVGVQLAAYGTRARAEQGWSDAQRRTDALKGIKYRVVEGKVDIGTVYRLQAVVGTRAEADRLCGALKADGVDCQVK